MLEHGAVFDDQASELLMASQIENKASLLIHSPKALKADNLTQDSLYGKMSRKFLNIGQSPEQNILTKVDFKLIDNEKKYYEVSFSGLDSTKKSFNKTIILQIKTSYEQSQIINSFNFIEKTKQGTFKEARSLAFDQVNLYKKVKGKNIRDNSILSFTEKLAVDYTEDYQKLILNFKGNDGKNDYFEKVTLSHDSEILSEQVIAPAPKKVSPPKIRNNNNNVIITEKTREILRPTLDEFLGSFKGKSSNNWDIVSAEIKKIENKDDEYQLQMHVGNPPRLSQLNFTLALENGKVTRLDLPGKRSQLYGWEFFKSFNVKLNDANQIILTCANAKSKGGVQTEVNFTLDRAEKILEFDFPQTYESDYKKSRDEYEFIKNNKNQS